MKKKLIKIGERVFAIFIKRNDLVIREVHPTRTYEYRGTFEAILVDDSEKEIKKGIKSLDKQNIERNNDFKIAMKNKRRNPLTLTPQEAKILQTMDDEGRNAKYPEFTVFWDYSYDKKVTSEELEKGWGGKDFSTYDKASAFYISLKCTRKQLNMYIDYDSPCVILHKTEDAIKNWCKEQR